MDFLPLLNVLLIPILIYAVKIEHRLTRLESLEHRMEALERRVFKLG